MSDLLLPGVAASRVRTSRLTQSVLHPEGVDPVDPGEAVVFVHGNVSSALFWQQALLDLSATGHRALAVDLRGYGDTDPLGIDARRGVRDWADDLAALVTALGQTGFTSSAGAWVPAWCCSTCSTRRTGWPRWRWSPRSRRTDSGGRRGRTVSGSTRTGPVRGRARPTRSSSPP